MFTFAKMHVLAVISVSMFSFGSHFKILSWYEEVGVVTCAQRSLPPIPKILEYTDRIGMVSERFAAESCVNASVIEKRVNHILLI